MSTRTTAVDDRADVSRAVEHAVRNHTSRRVSDLVVSCDGDVVTVHGVARTYHVWQIGLAAARNAARKAGGLLVNYQMQTVPIASD